MVCTSHRVMVGEADAVDAFFLAPADELPLRDEGVRRVPGMTMHLDSDHER